MKRATALKVLAGTLVLVMLASAFPLADVVVHVLQPEAEAPSARATGDDGSLPPGATPGSDLPPGAEGSSGSGAWSGSSSWTGASYGHAGRTGASGSTLLDNLLDAAELAGHAGLTVPDLPLDKLATQDPLRAAILEWIAVTGSQVPPEELAAELARADALPLPLQQDLAILLLSASQATLLQHQALARLTPSQVAWIHEHPEAAEDLLRGADTPEARRLAALAGLVDVDKSLQASLLMLSAVEATRGSLTRHESQRLLGELAQADLDEGTRAVLSLLATAGSHVSDADKVRFAARLIAASADLPLPAPQAPVSFEEAVAQLLAATRQAPPQDALDETLARVSALPEDLQGALAGILAAQARAVSVADPDRFTHAGQLDAMMGVLLATADALPVLEKYNLYWRHAPDALRVSQWRPSVRAGWAAEHAAMLVSTRADPVDVVRAGGILVGSDLVRPEVPVRTFEEAYLAVAKQHGVVPDASALRLVNEGAATLPPAVRDAAAVMLSGAAESARLQREAYAALSQDDITFLLTGTAGLDELYLKPALTQDELALVARASRLAAQVDLSRLVLAGAVGVQATMDARDLLAQAGELGTQSADATLRPTGWRALLERLLPFGTARAQSVPCADLGPARPRDSAEAGRDPRFALDGRTALVSNDCANDVLLRLELPSLASAYAAFGGASYEAANGSVVTPFCLGWSCADSTGGDLTGWFGTCDQTHCWKSDESNTEILRITGVRGSTVQPLTGHRVTLEQGTNKLAVTTPPQYGAALVSLDLGGSDTYDGAVAVTFHNATLPVSLHLDLGGADTYNDPTPLYDARSPVYSLYSTREFGHPTQASAAAGGVAVLVDALGDDDYYAAKRSQGYARVGVALLADLGGDDAYNARGVSQGAASESFSLGVGVLLDAMGNDRYRTDSGQGYGLGGILLDGGGQDSYFNDHDAFGVPVLHLDALPGGDLTALDEREDNRVWIDGPNQLHLGLAADVDVTLSSGHSDNDGDSDFLEFLAGSDPHDPDSKAVDGPGRRAALLLVDTDEDGYPDFVEAILSTDPESDASYPAGFPRGPDLFLPAETGLGSVNAGDAADGVEGPSRGDKVVDLRVPLQDAGTLDAACTGAVAPSTATPLGLLPGANIFEPGSRAPGQNPRSVCLWVTYDTDAPGSGNVTLPGTGTDFGPSPQSQSHATFRVPAGILAIGDSVDTLYEADYFLVVDLGGNDRFNNSAGGPLLVQTKPKDGMGGAFNLASNGGFLAPSLVLSVDPEAHAPQALNSPSRGFTGPTPGTYGDDVYANETRDYAHGSLFGILVDTGGDDLYVARNASQGSIGGLLLDLRDNDTYVAGTLSQGASLGATPRASWSDLPDGGRPPASNAAAARALPALLLDLGGSFSDSYTAGSHSQGYGRSFATTASTPDAQSVPHALGILLDTEGVTFYDTMSRGGRSTQGVGAQGGVGILYDGTGAPMAAAAAGVASATLDLYLAGDMTSHGATTSQTHGTGDPTAPAAPRPAVGILVDVGGGDQYKYDAGAPASVGRDRNSRTTVTRSETATTSTDHRAYADVGIHLDTETSGGDPMAILAGVGGTGGASPVDAGGWLVHLPSARLAIGNDQPNKYEREYAFVVDLGGSNAYNFTAGGFIADTLATAGQQRADGHAVHAGLFPVTFLLDAGNSSSAYSSSRAFSQGAGFFGVGMLVDMGGADVFEASPTPVRSFANGWASAPPVLDGARGSTEWDDATALPITMADLRDPRFNQTWTLRVMNDASHLYLLLEGETKSEGENQTLDQLVVDLNMGRRLSHWDARADRTGIDQARLRFDPADRSCAAPSDRHVDAQRVLREDAVPVTDETLKVGCRVSDGRVVFEMRKKLLSHFPLDAGDLAYEYDEDAGFDVRDLGIRLEFREAGTGFKNGNTLVHTRYAWPPGTVDVDGEYGHRLNNDLADELARWAVATLASKGERGHNATHTLTPAVSQGAAVAGVGVLAMLGELGADATLKASDRAQAYATYGGVAILVDGGGNDRYVGTDAVLGAADTKGAAIVLEYGGHDNYEAATPRSVGWSGAADSAAVFLDFGGDDGYAVPPRATSLGSAGDQSAPPVERDVLRQSDAAPGNNRAWTRSGGIGVDHRVLNLARDQAGAALVNHFYQQAGVADRVVLSITRHEPGAPDADQLGCTPRPVNTSAATRLPVVQGTACLRAHVNAPATPAGDAVNVTSVDFLVDGVRVLTLTQPNLTGLPRGASLWSAPVPFDALTDGVRRIRAVATFSADAPGGERYLFSYEGGEGAVKTVLLNNPPEPTVRVSPAYRGAANATFSPIGYAGHDRLHVNWTVPHDADEDRLAAYQRWQAPPELSNVPCGGLAGRLCHVLPFYLDGGEYIDTVPAEGAEGTPRTESNGRFESNGQALTYKLAPLKTAMPLTTNLTFRLALPDRTPLGPTETDYTTQVRISARWSNDPAVPEALRGKPVFTSAAGQEVFLVDEDVTVRQANGVSNPTAVAEDQYRIVYDTLSTVGDAVADNFDGNVLKNAIQSAVAVACPNGWNGTATGDEPCRNAHGDIGVFGSRPCKPRPGQDTQWIAIYPVTDWTRLCNERSAVNLTYMATDQAGPLARDLTPILGGVVENVVDQLTPPAPVTLGWRDMFFDLNPDLVQPGQPTFTLPPHAEVRLEFMVYTGGYVNVVEDVTGENVQGNYDEVAERFVSLLTGTCPMQVPGQPTAVCPGHVNQTVHVDERNVAGRKVSERDVPVDVNATDVLVQTLRGMSTTAGYVDGLTRLQQIPPSFFRQGGGPPSQQPRLEIRVPTEPSTTARVVLEPIDQPGVVAAVVVPEGLVEGDLVGSPTRDGHATPYVDAAWVKQWTTAAADRFTQRGDAFAGCCGADGGQLADGLYRVVVRARDAVGTGEVADTVLVDSVPPQTGVTTSAYVGKSSLENGQLRLRWYALDAGSRLNATYVLYTSGDPANASHWRMDGPFPPGQREHVIATDGARTLHAMTIGEDRAGNVESAFQAPSLAAALEAAKLARIGSGLFTTITIDEQRPVLGERLVSPSNLVAFQGNEFEFVRAGAPVTFSACAKDPDHGVGLVLLVLDNVNATSGEVISRNFTATESGLCADGTTRYSFGGWGDVNANKTLYPDGVWAASFEVYDLAGNRVSGSAANVILDSRPPTVKVQEPVYPPGQSAVKPGDRLAIRFHADDAFGVDDAAIRVDASVLTNATEVDLVPRRVDGVLYHEALIDVNRANLQNGVYEVKVLVPDHAGNVNATSAFVTVNFKKFQFVPGSLRVANVTHNSVVLEWETDDNTTSQARFGTNPVEMRGRTPLNATLNTSHRLLVDGLQPSTRYYLRAVSQSAGGHQAETDLVEVVTASALFLEPLTPKAGDAVSGPVQVKFRGGLRDSTDFVTYTLEAQSAPGQPWSFVTTATRNGENHTLTFNSTRYLDGTQYRLRLTAEAGKDATSVEIGPLLSDNTLPRLHVVGPLVATNDTRPVVVFEARDALAGFSGAPAALLIDGVRVDGLVVDPLPDEGLRFTYETPEDLPEGVHVLEARVQDKAGNVAVETWKVSIDGAAPVVKVEKTGYAPGTAAAKLGGTVTLNLTVTDASGVSLVSADTSALSRPQPSTRLARQLGTDRWTGTFPVTATESGVSRSVFVTATDLAGNHRVVEIAIPLDNVPPQVAGASVGDVGHLKASLSARADEPVLLTVSATAPRAPGASAATTQASRDARVEIGGLLPSRTYQYTLVVTDLAGNAATLAGSFATLEDTVAPSAVGALSVADLHNGTLRLSWAPAKDDVAVAGYRVYRSDDGVEFRRVAEVEAPTYDDGQLPFEKAFTYQVVAVDHGDNEGPASERLRAAATALPRLTAGAVTPTVGSTSTVFRYTVTYASAGGVAPAHVRVLIDGVPQNMTLESGTPLAGAVYVYETRLAPHQRDEPHTYSFEASDGRYTARFPEDGSRLRGPLVSGDLLGAGDATGFAAFAQRVPMGGLAGTGLALLVAAAVVAVVLRRKKEGAQ